MKVVVILVLCVVFVGCAGAQKQALKAAYDRGELTAAEYYTLEHQRQAEVKQKWSNALGALSQGCFNMADYMQRDRAINAMSQPQTIYVYPGYGVPGGGLHH